MSRRIVSLLPSATEIVCAVGARGELVGISHECDFPESVRGLPVLTSARIGMGLSSGEIDRAVRSVIRDALSIYSVDAELLGELQPDVIVTQDLCEVCAVSLDDVQSAVARLAKRDSIDIVSLRPTHLNDVLDDVARVGNALGRADEGNAVKASLERSIREIGARTARTTTRPRVVTIEWLEPIMLGGTWMPELIDLAGGLAVGVHAGEPAPTVSLDALAELHPDVVLVKPCGFPIERTLTERALVEQVAVRLPDARVYISDGNAFFNRPGPRLVESLEILAACVHPETFADFREMHRDAILEV